MARESNPLNCVRTAESMHRPDRGPPRAAHRGEGSAVGRESQVVGLIVSSADGHQAVRHRVPELDRAEAGDRQQVPCGLNRISRVKFWVGGSGSSELSGVSRSQILITRRRPCSGRRQQSRWAQAPAPTARSGSTIESATVPDLRVAVRRPEKSLTHVPRAGGDGHGLAVGADGDQRRPRRARPGVEPGQARVASTGSLAIGRSRWSGSQRLTWKSP